MSLAFQELVISCFKMVDLVMFLWFMVQRCEEVLWEPPCNSCPSLAPGWPSPKPTAAQLALHVSWPGMSMGMRCCTQASVNHVDGLVITN